MRRVYNKPYSAWRDNIREELFVTNFQGGGFMQETVRKWEDTDTFVMLGAGEIIGWALVDHGYTAMFYVKKEYRRQGVAKRLGERIKRKYGKDGVMMYSHSQASRALESSLFSENLVAN